MVSERYRQLELLGQGQMSVVWLALDTYTQEHVALKIMTAIHEDDRRNLYAQKRFQREIDIASSLQHPHVLPIRDFGYMQYEGRHVPYLVSPYIPEGSLVDLIKNRPPWKYWTLAQTADAVIQAANSLWYLHSRTPPIVHEDVKPGNFLFRSLQSPQRVVFLYLCDFGISRWNRTSTAIASELLGTFAFMAPEQTRRKVDCASDQYSLAIMTCYLLTGKLPLQALTNELYVEAHLHEPPLPPSMLNPERGWPPEVDEVILRALAKDPDQRFPTIKAFGEAFQGAIASFVQEQANLATDKDTVLSSLSLESTANKPLPIVPPVKLVISITLDPLEVNDSHTLDEPLPARPLNVSHLAAKGEGQVFKLLPLRGLAHVVLPARPKLLAWSRDGRSFACVLYSHTPVYLQRDGAVERIQTLHASQATCLCWSPDGCNLAIGSPGEIRFWNTLTQAALPLVLRLKARSIEGLDWSGDEQLAIWVEDQILIYPLSDAQLSLPQLSSPQIISTGAMRCGNVGVLRWSPDSSWLAAGASNGKVICWNVAHHSFTWQVAEQSQKVNSLAWSPDGALLAVAFRDQRVAGWRVSTRSEAFLWEKLPAMPRMLTISSANHITIASSEQRLLHGFPGESFPSAMLPGQLLAAWSPQQQELATLDEHKENVLVLWHA